MRICLALPLVLLLLSICLPGAWGEVATPTIKRHDATPWMKSPFLTLGYGTGGDVVAFTDLGPVYIHTATPHPLFEGNTHRLGIKRLAADGSFTTTPESQWHTYRSNFKMWGDNITEDITLVERGDELLCFVKECPTDAFELELERYVDQSIAMEWSCLRFDLNTLELTESFRLEPLLTADVPFSEIHGIRFVTALETPDMFGMVLEAPMRLDPQPRIADVSYRWWVEFDPTARRIVTANLLGRTTRDDVEIGPMKFSYSDHHLYASYGQGLYNAPRNPVQVYDTARDYLRDTPVPETRSLYHGFPQSMGWTEMSAFGMYSLGWCMSPELTRYVALDHEAWTKLPSPSRLSIEAWAQGEKIEPLDPWFADVITPLAVKFSSKWPHPASYIEFFTLANQRPGFSMELSGTDDVPERFRFGALGDSPGEELARPILGVEEFAFPASLTNYQLNTAKTHVWQSDGDWWVQVRIDEIEGGCGTSQFRDYWMIIPRPAWATDIPDGPLERPLPLTAGFVRY